MQLGRKLARCGATSNHHERQESPSFRFAHVGNRRLFERVYNVGPDRPRMSEVLKEEQAIALLNGLDTKRGSLHAHSDHQLVVINLEGVVVNGLTNNLFILGVQSRGLGLQKRAIGTENRSDWLLNGSGR